MSSDNLLRADGVLPVRDISDLSRADLGSHHVVRMMVTEQAEEVNRAVAESGAGGVGTHVHLPSGEEHSPFHGSEKMRREE